ncbi:MAG: hypothetical protein IJK62_12360 [Bacteroidales bacterium]|nr:hypothetical protein [Bacteroidales bacterium]MBQ6277483.1 hypothetical protein [Bacteroidales bacterium]
MRKFSILLVALVFTVNAFAQENDKNGEVNMMSKRGEYILPVEGDFALGINALPMVNYFGNLFNGTAGNSTSFRTFTHTLVRTTPVLFGKYYLTDKSAIRAGLLIGVYNETNRENVMMNQQIPDPKVTVTDVMKSTETDLGIGADYLMYRGKGRVQGFYGGGISVNYTKTKATYNYGNLITTEFSSPYWYDFAAGTTTSGGPRILSQSGDRSIGVVLSGVVGVEYFIAPKISIGGEFRLGLYTGYDFKGYRTVERWTGTEREVETLPKDANDGSIAFRNASSGSLFMMFHF